MAYGLIYKLRAESIKYGNDVVIEIHKDGYVGASSDKSLGSREISLSKDNESVIAGTSLTFTIQADVSDEYIDFFESPNRTYKAILKVNNVTRWTGYIVADEYMEEFRDPPYDVMVHAVDGLGLLKTVAYTIETAADARVTRFAAMNKCLLQTGHDFPIAIAYDVRVNFNNYNVFLGTVAADDYYDGWTCYEVLEKMIPPDATITQHNNQWLIRRNARDSEKTHLLYTPSGGTYTAGTQAGETALSLAPMGAGDVYPVGTVAEKHIERGLKKLTLKSEFGKRGTMLRNGNFRRGLENWTEANAVAGTTFTYVQDNIDYLLMQWYMSDIQVSTGTVSQIIPFTSEALVFSIRYCLLGYHRIESNQYIPASTMVRIKISITDHANTYFFSKFTGWGLSESAILLRTTSSPINIEWSSFSISIAAPPISGSLKIELMRPPYDLGVTTYDNMAVCFTDISIQTETSEDYNAGLAYEIPLLTNGTDTVDVAILPTDSPIETNFDYIFYNVNQWSTNRINEYTDGAVVTNWVNLIINNLIFMRGVSRQVIKGRFRGANLTLNSIIQCPATGNRKYYIQNGRHNLYDDSIEGELVEIPGSATGSTRTVPTTDWSSYAEQTSERTTGSASNNSAQPVLIPPIFNGYQGHIESDRLSDLVSRTVAISFVTPFSGIPAGIEHLRVYRWAQVVTGKWAPKDVKHYFTSSSALTNEGFTLEIDTTESLTGVIVEYLFIEPYEAT